MKKRALTGIILILALSISLATAQDETEANETTEEPTATETTKEQAAYDWLVKAAANGNYGNDVGVTALAGLALSNVGYDGSARLSAEWILTQKDAKNCFPKGGCTAKDTALALMLFDALGMPEAEAVQEWLEGTQAAATTSGRWLLEISTKATGKCSISYDLRNKTFTDEIDIEAGKFPGCGSSNFLDIDSCYKSGLLSSEPGLTFTVDCSTLEGETPIITLVYNTDNTYYIINTAFGNVAEMRVANGCYSRAAAGPCNKESSLYAAWALSVVGSPANINLYLLENYDATSVEDNALMYLTFLTKDEKYLEAIKTRQSSTDGSFNRDYYQTALAVMVLQDSPLNIEKVDKAKDWLNSKQSDDGSWRQNSRDTAMILYSAYGDAILPPEAVKELDMEAEAGPCNYDWTCDDDETAESCVDCQVVDGGEACNNDGVCDTLDGEDSDNCVDDCYCGDGICDYAEDSSDCPEDCPAEEEEEPEDEGGYAPPEEEGIGFGTIILIALIIILVVAGAWFAYQKFGKKEKPAEARPSPFGPRPGAPPFGRAAQKPATKAESQLQKSLEEARKLLRK